ncbi:hypothetical protein [Roseibium marinum]|uniref:Uncharacterized protein n=1 Tax=Roseibium marinum TaxID=281252 RepID=A0A2S3V1T6_9HYPH|nr:hypothetical protein [Roseibium marinum]POF33937.1 hypothetical protein CLV41_101386 [Roseibium marinum]
MTKKDERIIDLPSARELSTVLPAVRAVRGLANLALRTGLGGEKARKIMDSADQLLLQSDILSLPDRFNAVFVERGWIATASMSVDAMRTALKKHEEGDTDAGEKVILDWILDPETINLFAITRSKSFSDVHGRWHQLREALALTEEGRYWSAVPLVLIASDGFASDVLGTSPFEKNADLSLFDSMVAHPSSLPAAIARITKGVRKSSDDALSLPLRHGILHGRSLGYANRAVCGKAWMLMIALVDWAADKRDEEARLTKDEERRSTNWGDISSSLQKNRSDKAAIEAFVPRNWEGPFAGDLAEHEPPFAFHEFLTGWQTRNFGLMAMRAVNITRQKHGHLAGRMRADAEHMKLVEFEILSVSQTTVARAEARVRMKGQSLKGDVGGDFMILAFCHTASGEIAISTYEGIWQVQQGCIFDLMHERTIEKREARM